MPWLEKENKMWEKAMSIRSFIGAKNFDESRAFYLELGFKEGRLGENMSVFFVNPQLSFYLQRYYVKDWVNNSMLFLEVEDLESFYQHIIGLDLTRRYKYVRLKPIVENDWGSEFFLHDPSGILWHIGSFKN